MSETVLMFEDSSIINECIIKDSDIFKNVGYDNYIMLNRQFPKHFIFFEECYTEHENIGTIPGIINLYITGNPLTIKSDIVKTIYYEKWISSNSDLVLNSKKLDYKPIRFNNFDNIWIVISIVIIILFVIATYVLISNPIFDNIIKWKSNSLKEY